MIKIVEVARQLNVSRATVRAFIEKGDLKAVVVSPSTARQRKHVRILAESLEKLLEKRTGLRVLRTLPSRT